MAGVGIGIGLALGGSGGGGIAARAATVNGTATGTLYRIARLLGGGSTLALVGGSNGNLSLSGAALGAAAALGGASQTVVVRESAGTLAIEYPVTLTGNGTGVAPAPALPRLAAAIARVKSGGGRGVIAAVGDSVTRGWGAGVATGPGSGSGGTGGNFMVGRSWPHQLAALFTAAGIPARGDALFGTGNPTGTNQNAADVAASNPNVSFGSGWSAKGYPTLGGNLFYSADTSALGFTPEIAANGFDIYYAQNAGYGAITVSDGATALATIAQAGTAAFRKASVTRAAPSTAPIAIQGNGGGTVTVIAIVPYDTTAPRLEVWNMGAPGWKTADWQVATYPFSPFPALGGLQPDLFTIELGANDNNQGVTAAQFQSNLQALATQCRNTGADLLLVKTHGGNPHNGTGTDMTDAQLAAVDAVATAGGLLAPADFNHGVALAAGDYFDAIHLSQQGYGKEAAYLLPLLRRGAGA